MAFYDYIHVKGLDGEPPEDFDPEAFEIFQGLGGATAETGSPTVAPATPISTDSAIGEALWAAQDTVIERQTEFLKDLSDTYTDKVGQMPQDNLKDSLWQEVLEWAVPKVVSVISGLLGFAPGIALAKFLETWGGFLLSIGFGVADWLKKVYNAGSQLCESLMVENEALSGLEMTRENYALRRDVLAQHDAAAAMLINYVAVLEQQAATPLTVNADLDDVKRELQALREHLQQFTPANIQSPAADLDELIAAIETLQYRNIIVQGKDGKKLILTSSTVTEDQ